MNNRTTAYSFILVSIFMILGAASLLYNLEPMFDKVDKQIHTGETVVLDKNMQADSLAAMLQSGAYVEDPRDAQFIGEWIEQKLAEGTPIPNLGALKDDAFKIPIDSITMYGGSEFRARLETELERMGQDELWASLDVDALPATFGASCDSTALIAVRVVTAQPKFMKMIPRREIPEGDIVVRITEHWTNTQMKSGNLPVSHESETLGYAKTDSTGLARFYVPKGHFYSVVPIRKGYQYGQEKGTVDSCLIEDLKEIRFTQKEHKLTPIASATYRHLKADLAMVVRTPAQYRDVVTSGVAIFLACWLVLFMVIIWADRRKGGHTDKIILLSLMILTGTGLLTLYGHMLPLTDIFNARKTVAYIVFGCALMLALWRIDYLRLFQWYRRAWGMRRPFTGGILVRIAPGVPFLVLAVALMLLLRYAGDSPAGSDAKVNLFGIFQPSEVVKYIMLLFMAFFFIAEGDVIKAFGEKVTTHLARRRQTAIVSVIVVAIATVSLLYLAMLKDMGPGIVILATFILLYAIVRRDMWPLLIGIFSFIVWVGAAYMLFDNPTARVIAVVLWFVAWIGIGLKKYHTVFESAIFFNVLISMFLVGEYILRPKLPHMADRLMYRTQMTWSGIFDNAVPQGDQIAQGLWGTAAGGLTGMGLGGGSAHFIPAGHTDLILNSLGEQLGWIGILLVAVCYCLLISRTAVAAQYSAHKFTFYLCLGIGILTGVQFLFIALGSMGVIPLSGVPVPLLSYSGTSIVMALGAYGIVLSVSRTHGTAEALKSYIAQPRRAVQTPEGSEAMSLESNLRYGIGLFFVGIVSFVSINAYYQLIDSGRTLIRPAMTATASGLRVMEYNPRIKQIIEMMERGNIYDRNNLLLATSDRASLTDNDYWTHLQDSLKIKLPAVAQQKGKRLKRYYPFGSHTVFMVGDLNKSYVYTNYQNSENTVAPTGFFAENQEEDLLCGFESNPRTIELKDSKYKYNRFVAPITDVGSLNKVQLKDYAMLIPALSMPIHRNPWIEKFNKDRHKRDIHLTLDARLQVKIDDYMAKGIKADGVLNQMPHLRASAVVIDASTGDLLASSNYPLPVADSIVRMRELQLDRRYEVPSEGRHGVPVTDRDLGLTFQTAPGSTAKVITAMAGLMKIGADAYNQGFRIPKFMNVERPNAEPNIKTSGMNRGGGEKTYMENAIKHSSNCYFIMSLNENDLYKEVGEIYWNVGATLAGHQPYFFDMKEATDTAGFNGAVREFRKNGLLDYHEYMNTKGRLPEGTPWSDDSHRPNNRLNSIQQYTGIAWGQSKLQASPLNMAKVAGTVGNDGVLMPTRFVLNHPVSKGARLLDSDHNRLLAKAMNDEASRHKFPSEIFKGMGGKTGTPKRAIPGYKYPKNDGWYICYIRSEADDRVIAVALRLERLNTGITSSAAVRIMKTAILPALKDCGYISYDDDKQ